MGLVDDDEAKVVDGSEEGGTGADDDEGGVGGFCLRLGLGERFCSAGRRGFCLRLEFSERFCDAGCRDFWVRFWGVLRVGRFVDFVPEVAASGGVLAAMEADDAVAKSVLKNPNKLAG